MAEMGFEPTRPQTRSLRVHRHNHWTPGSVENRDKVGFYARTLILSLTHSLTHHHRLKSNLALY